MFGGKRQHRRKPNGPNFENCICECRILVAFLLAECAGDKADRWVGTQQIVHIAKLHSIKGLWTNFHRRKGHEEQHL